MRKLGALALVLGALISGCGDDDDDAAATGGDVERYCELVAELDEAGTEAFSELEADESATDDDYAAAERQFMEDHADDFDELREVAPDAIDEDIDTLIDAQEQRAAGGDQERSNDDVDAAEQRVQAFEAENCP